MGGGRVVDFFLGARGVCSAASRRAAGAVLLAPAPLGAGPGAAPPAAGVCGAVPEPRGCPVKSRWILALRLQTYGFVLRGSDAPFPFKGRREELRFLHLGPALRCGCPG